MIGTHVLGIYTVTKPIGEGGMGAVWLASSNTDHKIVIKVLHPEYTRHAAVMERFHREAATASRIRHPNVVQMLGSGKLDDGRAFLAMEWLDGKTLTAHMQSWGKLSADDALPILLQLCDGMQAAHAEGVVHRDMKPDNVFLCDEPRGLIKILDFGISKQLGAANGDAAPLTGSGVLMGTPWYMAPEQAESARAASPVSDIFAIGVIAFELLAGVRPYRSDGRDDGPLTFLTRYTKVAQGVEPRPSLASAAPGRTDIPEAWIRTIDRAIDVRPNVRPQTVREFIEPLYRAMPHGETIARHLSPGLFTAASPADETRRAASGDATRPGTEWAPQALPGPSTLHAASGQVAVMPAPSRVRRSVLAIIGAALVVGVAAALATVAANSGRASSDAPPEPAQDAATAIDAGASVPLASPIDAQALAPIDAGAPIDAAAPIDASKKRRKGDVRRPDDID